jgi:hypothetical protein
MSFPNLKSQSNKTSPQIDLKIRVEKYIKRAREITFFHSGQIKAQIISLLIKHKKSSNPEVKAFRSTKLGLKA